MSNLLKNKSSTPSKSNINKQIQHKDLNSKSNKQVKLIESKRPRNNVEEVSEDDDSDFNR